VTSRRLGALYGVTAGAVALSVASVGGKLVDGTAPPLQLLGDWVIRSTPISVTEQIIGAVGTHDKQLLQLVMTVVAAAAFAVVGIGFTRGRRVEALVLVAALTVLPAIAGSSGRELIVMMPAGLLGALVLRALAPSKVTDESPPTVHAIDRRQALTAGLVLVASAAIGVGAVRQLGKPSKALMTRLRAALPRPTKPLPALVDELGARGAPPLVTPNDDFYRIDISQTPPQVEPADWSLTISRDGSTLAELSYDDLLALSLTQADITIGCVSNEIGGDLVGTARWQGVLLGQLLRSAGVTSAGRITGVSVDGFTASFAGHYAFDGRPSLVAVGMNDQVLPVRHGFPARLVVPGLYGYTSATKWLQTIDVSDSTSLPGFWASRGWAPAVEVHVMSRIDAPGGSISSGSTSIAGIAWAPIAGVGSVEVSIDDAGWVQAELSRPVSGVLWRQWALPWQATAGRHRISVRATDTHGRMQDTKVRPVYPSGATGLHTVAVTVR
jgi:DMSO/TMAO reductase YedYZ molybdopterin-dependent catalytic subunit